MDSDDVTVNDGSIGSLSTLEADDQHLMLHGKRSHSRSSHHHGMSVPRRVCFVGSIVVLLGCVLIFLFILPCPEEGVCPSIFRSKFRKNWLRDYDDLELMGPVNIVRTGKMGVSSLIFMYRRDNFTANKKFRRPNGIMAILSHTGAIAWNKDMSNQPKYVNCTIVDLNLDGEKDCLIVDTNGQMASITVNGEWIWKPREFKGSIEVDENKEVFTYPLILPDLNGDKVNEFLHILRTNEQNYNTFSLLSGKNGKTMGKTISVGECSAVMDLEFGELYTIRYRCVSHNGTYSKSIALNDLYKALTDKSIDVGHLNATVSLTQINPGPQNTSKIVISHRNVDLVVENNGICPGNCNATVSLMQNSSIIFNRTARNMFIPPPISFTFKNKFGKYGFVFKHFQWGTDNLTTNSKIPQMRILKETVTLIMFNSLMEFKMEDSSKYNIIQLCRLTNNGKQNCQPKIANQLHSSMIITDIDSDDSQELITFHSTFGEREPGSRENSLKTYVQLLDIESEIPKLYGGARK